MIVRKHYSSLAKMLLVIITLFMMTTKSFSQIVRPSGTSDQPSSQLTFWYDEDQDVSNRFSWIQITNTSLTNPVNIHVQIFQSFVPEGSSTPTICFELDFVDSLTPGDTHTYVGDDLRRNSPPSVPVGADLDNTKGFVVITPVVSPADFTAISFQHLIGTSTIIDNSIRAHRVNAMGRDAVDFVTGLPVPEFTPLDGVTNGFVLIQPEILEFNFRDFCVFTTGVGVHCDKVDVVNITFRDSYTGGVFGGYTAEPGDSEWHPILYDSDENAFSCDFRTQSCFSDIGLTDDFDEANPFDILDANILIDDDVLCPGVSAGDFLSDPTGALSGWAKIFVEDLDDFENQLGLFAANHVAIPVGAGFLAFGGADWMHAEGDRSLSECDATDPSKIRIIGTAGNDNFIGTPGDDIIIGLGGDDLVDGGEGNDCIDGGDGNDDLRGGKGNDQIFGGSGNDSLTGKQGNDSLDGGVGTDTLDGDQGTDTCINGESNSNCEL